MGTVIDDDFGFDIQQGYDAVDRMRPLIQRMLESEDDIEIVLTVLGEGFFNSLRLAGASKWQAEKWAKRAYGKIGAKSNFGIAVQNAYEPIGEEMTALINEGCHPLALAWNFNGAIGNIVGTVFGRNSREFAWVGENLIMFIRVTRASSEQSESH